MKTDNGSNAKAAALERDSGLGLFLCDFRGEADYTQPCACMAVATFSKPARFAPASRLPLTP